MFLFLASTRPSKKHGKASKRSNLLTMQRSRGMMLQLRFVQEPFDKHRKESDGAHCQIHGEARNHPCAIVNHGLQSLSNDFLGGDNEKIWSGMLLKASSARRECQKFGVNRSGTERRNGYIG